MIKTLSLSSLSFSFPQIYQKWTSSASLQQLRLEDTSDPRDGVIFVLSKDEGLARFENVVLVGSGQDVYVAVVCILLFYFLSSVEERKGFFFEKKNH